MTDAERERLAVELITEGVKEGLVAEKKKADRKLVRELVSNKVDGSSIRKTGFSDLCRETFHAAAQDALRRAEAELRRNPNILASSQGEGEFLSYWTENHADANELYRLVERCKRRHPLGI
jgi:hypothetical protein